MARRDQPYFPLYVQDFLTDEKLIECSAESTGVYIRLLCIMHKSQEYGKILLKQKDKQKGSMISDFAFKLSKQMPWDMETILRGLTELVNEGVVTIDGDTLFQKRMVKDGYLSDTRANAGKKGGKKAQQKSASSSSSSGFASGFASDFAKAKSQANTENEDEDEYTLENESDKEREEGCRGEEGGAARHGNDPLRNPEIARVMSHYFDTIDPTPSTTCMQELVMYTKQFGADIIIHAIDRARDMKKQQANWLYIRGILRSYAKSNVQTIGDVFRDEQEFDAAMDRKAGPRGSGGRPAQGAMDDLRALHEYFDGRDGS